MGLRQTDEETGHNKTRKHLARRMVKHVRQLSAQSHKEMGRRKTIIGCSESKDNSYSVANDDPGYEDITNNAERNGK